MKMNAFVANVLMVGLVLAVALFASPGNVRSQADYISEAKANLRSPDPKVRLYALGTINTSSYKTFEIFIDFIDDPDEDVRGAAVMNLGGLKDKRATPSLIRVLRDEKIGVVRVNAAWALGNIGDPEAVEPMLEILRTAPLGMQFHIIEALGRLDDPRSVQPLFALRKTDAGGYALDALGKSAVEPMCEILTRGPSIDRWHAVTVLERIADERAIGCLISVLGVGESAIGMSAANALSWRIGKSAVEPLIDALNAKTPQSRANAVLALGQIRDEQATSALLGMIDDDEILVRRQVVDTLSKLVADASHPCDERIVGALLAATRDREGELRLAAVKALSNLRGEEVAQAFILALSDPATAHEAAIVLGTHKDVRVLPRLIEVLKSEIPLTRQGLSRR